MPEQKGGNPPAEYRFKPGQSGNPGGKTKEQRRLEVENAERATRIRGQLLAALEETLLAHRDVADLSGITQSITGDNLRMLKDAEDRGLGAPKQTVELADHRKTDEELVGELIEGGIDPKMLEDLGFDVAAASGPDGDDE